MDISIGDVRIGGDDVPETFAPDSALTGGVDQLSDGSQLYSRTGFAWGQITLDLKLRLSDAFGRPIDKYNRLLAMEQAGQPVRLIVPGFPIMSVTIIALKPRFIRTWHCDLTLTLFRGVDGGLITQAPRVSRTPAARAATRIARIGALAPGAGPNTGVAAAALVLLP